MVDITENLETITPDQLIAGEDIIVAVAKSSIDGKEPAEGDYYAIGLLQGGGENDARPITEMGELGSSRRFLAVGDNRKGARLNRLEVVGKNILYGMYCPYLMPDGDTDFKKLRDVIASDALYEDAIEPSSTQDDLQGAQNVIFGVINLPANEEYDQSNVEWIGLMQSLSITSTNKIDQISELGSIGKYVIAGKGDKNLTIGKMITEKGNIIRALYPIGQFNGEGDLSEFTMITDLDNLLTKKVCRPVIGILDNNSTVISSALLNGAIVSNIGNGFQYNDLGVVENAGLKWGNTTYSNTSDYATNIGDLSKMPICLDHDVFRKPLFMKLVYMKRTKDGVNREQYQKKIWKNVLISSIEFGFTAGSLFSVGGVTVEWEKTVNEQITGN